MRCWRFRSRFLALERTDDLARERTNIGDGGFEEPVVEQRLDSPEHARYQELLGAAAVDALTDDERLSLARHLATCQSCREELAALRAAAQAFPLALEDREPPPIVRFRIQAAIQHELDQQKSTELRPMPPQLHPVAAAPTPIRRRGLPRLVPWAAAAIFLVAALGLLAWNLSLRNETTTPTSQAIALQATQANNGAQGILTYLPDQHIFVLSFDRLPALPANRVYQVWLIHGKSPVPSGVFGVGTSDFAISGNRSDFQTLAITVEPGPLGSAAPTSSPILAASL